ncbi:hypothetical protein SAMN05443549_101538 [Flavobacterium fluvii]|uniref:Uncharacterized protein n=1 Tax=Flavobacterium fluvii TaxID=468056 RepID=A0A1M5EYU0_9FLAO|nr:hypothetical protein SAMN05443549_101538 [Flavobacterium fluvii]
MKTALIFIILVLIIGYQFKGKKLIINIKDTYFVMSYFTLAIYIAYGTIIIQILLFIVKYLKSR